MNFLSSAKCILILKLIVLSIMTNEINAEIYTSIDGMTNLLDTEDVVISKILYYIKEQENRLAFMKNQVDEYIAQYNEAIVNVTNYIANPINAYLLTKRLSQDLYEIRDLMREDIIDPTNPFTDDGTYLSFPNEEDLSGSAVAIVRLQETYNLNATEIADGHIDGYIEKSPKLSSSDCFQIGLEAFKISYFKYAIYWFKEALDRYSDNLIAEHYLPRGAILGHLAATYGHIGNITGAIYYTNLLLEVEPNNEIALNNSESLKIRQLNEQDVPVEPEPYEIEPVSKDLLQNKTWMTGYDFYQRELYKKMCRKEIVATPKQQAPLRCRYVTNKSAFLRIAPLKLEESSLDPYIVTYHDVIYQNEIDELKELAKLKLTRASVISSKEVGVQKPVDYRISKFAWMKDQEHKFVKDIGVRVQDMTGMTVSTAEELQVLNYGIGGHYEPHFDFGTPINYTSGHNPKGTDNRIATVLFYMSDVAEGGATVFPLINVALWPRKGSAAFWYNLYKSGEGDFRTKHAACPVFVGSKWICNKWLHVRNQEFLRPCGLNTDHPNYAVA